MLAISVMVETHPEFTEQYREAALRHANNSLTNEEGCLKFSVHRHPENPNRFFLYESYRSQKDLTEVHNVSSYMAEFKELTANWTKTKEIIVWDMISPE